MKLSRKKKNQTNKKKNQTNKKKNQTNKKQKLKLLLEGPCLILIQMAHKQTLLMIHYTKIWPSRIVTAKSQTPLYFRNK